MSGSDHPDLELVPRRTALRTMGMSVRTGDRREKSDPTFPPRVVIGPGRYAYRKADLLAWIERRVQPRATSAEAAT
jgi:predicted DNA-binding transcriptional regulator AlpA